MCKHGMIDGMHAINNSGCYVHWWVRSVSPLTIITNKRMWGCLPWAAVGSYLSWKWIVIISDEDLEDENKV